jgi:hypothetical protein
MLRPNTTHQQRKFARILALAAVVSFGATPAFAKGDGGAENPGGDALDDAVYVIQRESVCMSGGPCEFVAHCPGESTAQGRLPNGAPYCTPTGPAHTVIP